MSVPHVVNGATLQCPFGVAPSTMVVLPLNRMLSSNMPAATIMDHIPMTNIMPFGMCSAPTNPAVIAATSAASGVFTPAPCIPATVSPWVVGAPTVQLGNFPCLNMTATCMCMWGGAIKPTNAGQTKELIPP